jgi:hypothetical protein
MKKLLIICLSLFAFNFTAQAQLIDNQLKKDVNQEFYQITCIMDGNDIDLVIPMNKIEFLKSDFDVNCIEFEFDYKGV